MTDIRNDPYGTNYYNQDRATHTRTDISDAVRTANINNEFLLVPNDISTLRDVLAIDGDYVNNPKGNTSRLEYNEDTYLVKTTATGTDTTSLETARIGTYRPGSEAIAGIYFQKDNPPVGKVEWGYGREPQTIETVDVGKDGFYWRYTSDGSVSFVIERNDVETEIPSSDWDTQEDDPREITDENGDISGWFYGLDAVDGMGPSSEDLDPANGYIYRVDFTWYGGGVVVPKVVTLDKYGRQRSIDLFAFKPRDQTSISQPNQPVFARVDNQGTATADQCKVAGRQFSVVGDFEDTVRETSHLETGVTIETTDTHVLSFRRKPGFEGVEIGISDVVTFLNQRSLGYLIIGADYGAQSPSWETPSGKNSASETAIEVATVDGGATNLTIDETVGARYNGTIFGQGKNSEVVSSRGPIRFPVPRNVPCAFVARSLTGNNDTAAELNPRFIETW